MASKSPIKYGAVLFLFVFIIIILISLSAFYSHESQTVEHEDVLFQHRMGQKYTTNINGESLSSLSKQAAAPTARLSSSATTSWTDMKKMMSKLDGNKNAQNPPNDGGNEGKQHEVQHVVSGDSSAASSVVVAQQQDDHPYPWRRDELFLHFTPWAGMWNNMRQSFEIALHMACLLNRTLLVPEPHDAHVDTWKSAKILRYEDGYDAKLWAQNFPSILLSNFLRHNGVEYISKRDGYPTPQEERAQGIVKGSKKELQSTDCGVGHQAQCHAAAQVIKRSYKYAMHTDEEYFVWGPSDYFPKDPTPKNPPDLPTHSRKRRDFAATFVVPDTVVYISGGLTTWYHLVYSQPNNAHGNQCKKKMVENLQYNANIREWATKIVDELGGRDKFSAIHMRRSDFKKMYKSFVHPPADLLVKFEKYFKVGEPTLIATEAEEEVRDLMRDYKGPLTVKFFSDLDAFEQMKRKVPANQHPLVEQMVMVETRAFVGNHLSTFSMYVIRLRMFRDAKVPEAYTEAGVTPQGIPRPLPAWARFAWESGTDWKYPAPR